MNDASIDNRSVDGHSLRKALSDGDGDPNEALRAYLEAAEPRLAELLWRIAGTLEPDDFNLLGHAHEVLVSLLLSMHGLGGRYRLEFTRRPGNPGRTSGDKFKAAAAAIQAMSLIAEDRRAGGRPKLEAVIAQVKEETGVGRREIFRHKANFERIGRMRSVSQKPED